MRYTCKHPPWALSKIRDMCSPPYTALTFVLCSALLFVFWYFHLCCLISLLLLSRRQILSHSMFMDGQAQTDQCVLYAKSLQSCPTLCDAMDCSPPGSSVHGIFQARILEWVAMPSSRGSSQPRDPTRNPHLLHLHWQAGSLPLGTWEAPSFYQNTRVPCVPIVCLYRCHLPGDSKLLFSLQMPLVCFFRIFKVFPEFVTVLLLSYILALWL